MRKIGRNYYIYGRVQGVGFRYHTLDWGKNMGYMVMFIIAMMVVSI